MVNTKYFSALRVNQDDTFVMEQNIFLHRLQLVVDPSLEIQL